MTMPPAFESPSQSHRRFFARRGQVLVAAVLGCLVLVGAPDDARSETRHHEMVLGLKDKEFRNIEGIRALRARVRARLVAAQIKNFTLKIDRSYNELHVVVHDDLDRGQLRRLLVSRGQVEVAVVKPLTEVVEQLRGSLPPGVVLDWEGREPGKGEVLLASRSQKRLSEYVNKLVLADDDVFVGRRPGDGVAPWRTYGSSKSSPRLTSAGLSAVNVTSGVHPNYHYVSTYWTTSGDESSAGDVLAVSSAALGSRLALILDGFVVSTIAVATPVTNGELLFRMPTEAKHEQRLMARLIAGRLASGPHPCTIAVVSEKTL